MSQPFTLPFFAPIPVCSPGAPASVPLGDTAPAVPLGVAPADSSPTITVTAVTVLFPPFGNVAVLNEIEVLEGPPRLLLEDDVITVSDEALDEAEPWMVRTPPPTVVTTVKPSALVVVMTSPAVGSAETEGEGEGDGDSEGGAVVAAGLLRDVLVETTVTVAEPVSVVDPASAVVGPTGTGVETLGVEPGAGSGVDGEDTGAAGDVPLSARLANCTIEDARLASSR